MQALENRIPPPIVFTAVAGLLWLTARAVPPIVLPLLYTEIPAALFFISAGILGAAAVFGFGRAGTTIDPVNIDRAATLVTTGIYGATRNPMYLAMTFLLMAEALALRNLAGFAWAVGFALFVTRFQNQPEERVLSAKFGTVYTAYRARVRRWI